MAGNKDIGDHGESLAATYLANKGYLVLERNWRYKRAEVDLICKAGKLLVFVEVKTRRSKKFGEPEEAVHDKKQQQLVQAAQEYIEQSGHEGEIRFDIIAIELTGGRQQIRHFEDAFFPYQE